MGVKNTEGKFDNDLVKVFKHLKYVEKIGVERGLINPLETSELFDFVQQIKSQKQYNLFIKGDYFNERKYLLKLCGFVCAEHIGAPGGSPVKDYMCSVCPLLSFEAKHFE